MIGGDPSGEAVLRELADDPAPHVQIWANFGLKRIHSPDDADAGVASRLRYTSFDTR